MGAKVPLAAIADLKIPFQELNFPGRLFRILILSGLFFVREGISRQAKALTYYTLFSIVPLAALCFGIAKGFALDEMLYQTLKTHFSGHEDTLNWIYQFANTTLREARGGVIAGVGVLFLFSSVVLLASNAEDTFNMIWGLPRRNNLVGRISDYLAILVLMPLLLIVAGSGSVVLRTLLVKLVENSPQMLQSSMSLLLTLTHLIPYLFSILLFWCLYRFVPNTKVSWRSSMVAGICGGVAFQALQASLIYLQVALSKYNAIYGSFALVPLFLLWLQWSWMIVLFCAELGFVHQNAPTGRFEYADWKISRRERRKYLLAVTREVILQVEDGKGGMTAQTLCAKLDLSPFILRDLLLELTECGVLLAVQGEKDEISYVPALPAHCLTVTGVWDLLDARGGDQVTAAEPRYQDLEQVRDQLRRAAESSPGNRPLGEI